LLEVRVILRRTRLFRDCAAAAGNPAVPTEAPCVQCATAPTPANPARRAPLHTTRTSVSGRPPRSARAVAATKKIRAAAPT